MQIIFRGTTATTCITGGSITTGNVQVLPAWAPPIEFIATTDENVEWLVDILNASTYTKHLAVSGKQTLKAIVRDFGRKDELYSGAQCIALSRALAPVANIKPMIVLNYRAVGELNRP